jgi:hypothetical protein
MAVANTLAYYITATITAVKSFIVQAPGLIFAGMAENLIDRGAPLVRLRPSSQTLD